MFVHVKPYEAIYDSNISVDQLYLGLTSKTSQQMKFFFASQ